MRPQRACTKQADSTPHKSKRAPLSEFFPNTPSPSPVKAKRKAKDSPDNKRKRTKEDPAPKLQSNNSPAKKYKRVTNKREVDEDESDKENEEDPPTQPAKPSQSSKPDKTATKPKPASKALVLSPHPSSLPRAPPSPPTVPLAQQRPALQDPVIAMAHIIGDEIKAASAKICSLESEMVLAKPSKEFIKTQDHRYQNLRAKFDELKESKKFKEVPESATTEEWKDLIAQMKEGMKELAHDQNVVRKKLKEQTKELNQGRAELAEEKKALEVEKMRVEEEGREIEIEKRRMERKEIEKERQDIERQRWVLGEDKKELELQKKKSEEEMHELERRKRHFEDHKAESERERRRIAEEQAKEQRRLEAWEREVAAEKRKLEEQRYRWEEEKRNMAKHQEELLSGLKYQLESEKQVAVKSKQDNAQLADQLNMATHRWAEHQEKMDREIEAMVKLVNTSEKESDVLRFLCMITGLTVHKLAPNRFQCECSSGNKSKVQFEVTIREADVEYTPLEVVGKSMPECVKESIFFQREDWPIFLCKIISSVFRA